MKRIVLGFGIFLMGAVSVSAQTAATKAEAQKFQDDFLIQEQKWRQDQKDKVQQQRFENPPKPILAPEVPTAPSVESGVKFQITTIFMEGATQLSKADQGLFVQPYVGKEMSLSEINSLVSEVQNHYIRKGFVTTRVFLAKQNLKEGKLKLSVVEGVVEDLVPAPLSGITPFQLAMAFPNIKGKVLNLRDIEQGLDQLNRLASNQATMHLVPSKEHVGETLVVIDNKQKYTTFGLTAYYDNNNQNYYPKIWPRRVGFFKDNPLFINDNLGITYAADTKGSLQSSYSTSVAYSVPFGFSSFSANYSQFEYQSVSLSNSGASSYYGKTLTYGGRWDQVVLRGLSTKSTLYSGLVVKDTTSFVNDVAIQPQTRKLTIWELGFQQTYRDFTGNWSLDLKQSQGLKKLDATVDEPSTSTTAQKAQFHKTEMDLSYFNAVQISNMPLLFRSNFRAQYTQMPLYATERIALGDPFTVRGYLGSPLVGDKGMYVRNEVAIPVGSVQLYAAYDIGNVGSVGVADLPKDSQGLAQGWMSGCAIGVRYFSSAYNLDLTYARALRASNYIEQNHKQGYEIYWNLSVPFI